MIDYRWGAGGIEAEHMAPFFVGWPSPPSAAHRLRIVRAATEVITAWQDVELIGFATAIADGLYAAFIPLVEVVPEQHGNGVGTEMVRQMLNRLQQHYSIDLACDPDVTGFYTRLDGLEMDAVGWRNRSALH